MLGAGSRRLETAEATIFQRGYIGNLRDIAMSLDMGDRPSANVDEALVLCAARARWGFEFASRLEGEFALVWIDRRSGDASLHHDEFGLMPLFYSADRSGLRVAFHLNELASTLGETDLDPDYIRERLRFGDTYGDRTPYRSIKRLLPGQCALWNGEQAMVRDCWSPAPTSDRKTPRSFEDNAAELRGLIGAAVSSSLPASGRTWGELSGGLDSSTVVATAMGNDGQKLEAVTYMYPQSPEANESAWVERFRAEAPLPIHTVDGDAWPPFTRCDSGIVAEPTAGLMHAGRDGAVERLLAAHDVDVVLTGMGGDEILFGYRMKPFFLVDQLRAGRVFAAAADLRRWAGAIYPRRSALFWLLRAGDPAMFAPHSRQSVAPWLSPETIRHADREARAQRPPWPGESSLSKRRYMEAVLAGARVVSTCVASRRSRAEFRSPLFHRPLVQFCRDLPWDHQAGGTSLRPLLRAATSGVLPEAIRLRTDKPNFDQALFRGLRSPGSALNGDGRASYLAQGGFIDPDAWDAAKQKARLGFAPDFKAFLTTANLEIWLRSRFGAP